MELSFDTIMSRTHLESYLRYHRLRSGLSQRDLAEIVGFIANHQVSRHEHSAAIPSLLAALSYRAVFCIPIEDLFPGVAGTIQVNVEDRLARMESNLQTSSAKGHRGTMVARKLEWLSERRNHAQVKSPQ